jgi:hypothetical protein
MERTMNIVKLNRRVGLMVLTVSLFAATSWAGDVLQIAALLASPMTYHGQRVRVTGVVSGLRMETLVHPVTKQRQCTQHFTIADDSGAIDATAVNLCPAVTLKTGDRATIDAHFVQGPDTKGGLSVWGITMG